MTDTTITITPGVLDLLRRYRIGTRMSGGERWREGDRIRVADDAEIEAYSHIFDGYAVPAAVGAFTYSSSPFLLDMRIGRYCSFSWNIEPMGSGHPVEWLSTSPFSCNPRPVGGFAAYLQDRGVTRYDIHSFDFGMRPITIGHDVWIAAGALIKRGVTIGTGAVVGARAVVTKDVPPYAIVVGTPARIVRHRFPDAQIERLLQSEWWRYGPDVLQPLDVREPEAFVGRLGQAIADGAKPMDIPVLTGRQIIAGAAA